MALLLPHSQSLSKMSSGRSSRISITATESKRSGNWFPRFAFIRHSADAEGTHRLCIGMRFSCHEVTFDVPAELIAKHLRPVFPKRLATWRANEVHDNKLPAAP